MITMAMLGKIRRLYFRDGLSIKEICRRTSLSRNTVRRRLREPEAAAPKYRRREVPTKLAPFVDVLKTMLEADSHRPKAQRRTAKPKFCSGPFGDAAAALDSVAGAGAHPR